MGARYPVEEFARGLKLPVDLSGRCHDWPLTVVSLSVVGLGKLLLGMRFLFPADFLNVHSQLLCFLVQMTALQS
jgi:hypothetical protein